jgi:hypothetical protein
MVRVGCKSWARQVAGGPVNRAYAWQAGDWDVVAGADQGGGGGGVGTPPRIAASSPSATV